MINEKVYKVNGIVWGLHGVFMGACPGNMGVYSHGSMVTVEMPVKYKVGIL